MKKIILLIIFTLSMSACSDNQSEIISEVEEIEIPIETIEVIKEVPIEEMEILDLLKIKLSEKGYIDSTIIELVKELKLFELTPLLVFDYVEDINLYIEDCISHRDTNSQDYFVLSNNYTSFYQNTMETKDIGTLKVLVNKNYYLPSDYIPDVVPLSAEYARDNMSMVEEAADMFMKMSDAAAAEGLKIYGTSGYRSYDRQEYLYNNYKSQWGEFEADNVSARPGHSEHQTGLVMDLTVDGGLSSFTGTDEDLWMMNHSFEYGFILRYPENKSIITGYNYESWHYRYIGIDLAKKVYDSNMTYDEYYNLYLKS